MIDNGEPDVVKKDPVVDSIRNPMHTQIIQQTTITNPVPKMISTTTTTTHHQHHQPRPQPIRQQNMINTTPNKIRTTTVRTPGKITETYFGPGITRQGTFMHSPHGTPARVTVRSPSRLEVRATTLYSPSTMPVGGPVVTTSKGYHYQGNGYSAAHAASGLPVRII